MKYNNKIANLDNRVRKMNNALVRKLRPGGIHPDCGSFASQSRGPHPILIAETLGDCLQDSLGS